MIEGRDDNGSDDGDDGNDGEEYREVINHCSGDAGSGC